MKKIITAGETVLDIIFKDTIPIKATPGGSMLNTAVSLGRLNTPVYLLTEFGNDLSGKLIINFLKENGVKTDYIYRYKEGQTPLAIAFLDENNNAEYNFYKIYPPVRMNIKLPEFKKNDIFLFGSFLAIDRKIRNKITGLISKLKEKGVIIVYDPNFRKSHLSELKEVLPLIKENINFADIIKGSNEDFNLIFNTDKIEEIYEIIGSLGSYNLLITGGDGDVIVKTKRFTKNYPVKKIKIKSTIGAGDNFNAGILYSLFTCNIKKEEINTLEEDLWNKIVEKGIKFSQKVCESYENYIDYDFASEINGTKSKHLPTGRTVLSEDSK